MTGTLSFDTRAGIYAERSGLLPRDMPWRLCVMIGNKLIKETPEGMRWVCDPTLVSLYAKYIHHKQLRNEGWYNIPKDTLIRMWLAAECKPGVLMETQLRTGMVCRKGWTYAEYFRIVRGIDVLQYMAKKFISTIAPVIPSDNHEVVLGRVSWKACWRLGGMSWEAAMVAALYSNKLEVRAVRKIGCRSLNLKALEAYQKLREAAKNSPRAKRTLDRLFRFKGEKKRDTAYHEIVLGRLGVGAPPRSTETPTTVSELYSLAYDGYTTLPEAREHYLWLYSNPYGVSEEATEIEPIKASVLKRDVWLWVKQCLSDKRREALLARLVHLNDVISQDIDSVHESVRSVFEKANLRMAVNLEMDEASDMARYDKLRVDDQSWECKLPDGWKLLKTRSEHRIEGMEMSHCVGSYWGRSITGGCFILARNVEGARATLELNGIAPFRVQQLYGPGNSHVGSEISAEAAAIVKMLNMEAGIIRGEYGK